MEIIGGASKKDHQAALAAVGGLPENLKMQAIGAVLSGWADQDPIAALAWSASNGVDPTEAKAIRFWGTDGMNWTPLSTLAFFRDGEKTLDWVRTQPASAERDVILSYGLWNGPLEQRFKIYAELTRSGQANGAADLVRTALPFEGHRTELESWAKDLPPGAGRAAAIRELTKIQARDLNRIEELANAWPPGPDRDASLGGIASSLADNPPRALEFARKLIDPTTRESTFEKIAQSWISEDKPAACAWITNAPELTAEQKRVLLRQADEQ